MGMDAQLSAILGDMETWQRPPPSRGKDSETRRENDEYQRHRPSFSGNSLEFLPPTKPLGGLVRASTRTSLRGFDNNQRASVRSQGSARSPNRASVRSPQRGSVRSPQRGSVRALGAPPSVPGAASGPPGGSSPPARRSTRRQSTKQAATETQLARVYQVKVDLPTPSPLGRPSRARKSTIRSSPYATSPNPTSPVFSRRAEVGAGAGDSTFA